MPKKVLYLVTLLFILLTFSLGQIQNIRAQADTSSVVVITLEGPLTPVWSNYLERGIDRAVSSGANLLVVELNTPGGSITIMNGIVEQLLASPVPVAVYVTPRGAMAASAGTLVVLAGHVAAMSPESAIGAASPVGQEGQDLSTTEETKTKEILKASVLSLAERRGAQAVALAESAIDSAKAASSSEALKAGLIDYVASDLEDLLAQLDGKTVVLNGNTVVLNLQGARINPVGTTPVEDVLNLLTNPNIVFLLLSVGIQAILIELSSPGGWVAGFTGAVLLALSIYGIGILPVNWFGLVFLLIALILFILDIKAPTHGALTAAGTGSFIAGALILFNSVNVPGFGKVSVGLVIGVGLFIGLTFLGVVLIAMRAMKKPIATGMEVLDGRTGTCVTDLAPGGIVQVGGEQWSAVLEEAGTRIEQGARVKVVRVEGVRLVVRGVDS